MAALAKRINRRNGKIEFLRFVFALYILFFHISKRFYGTNGIHTGYFYYFTHGVIGVEFFFLVSGYLLGKKAYRMRNSTSMTLGSETYRVMRAKIANVFPMAFCTTALTILVNMFALHDNWTDRGTYLIDSWPSLFLLNLFGFESTWVNKLTWYLSAYLMCTAILYPLARRYYDMFTYIVCPLGALFILGWMDKTRGYLCGADIWTGLCYFSFLRGLSEMALGIFAFHITRYVNRRQFNEPLRKFLIFIEPVGYLFILVFVNLRMAIHTEFIVLFILFGLTILSFSNLNPMEKVFNRPVILWLGRFSLSLYLNQFYVIRLVMLIMKDYDNGLLKAVIIVICTLICSVISDWLFNSLLPARRRRKETKI